MERIENGQVVEKVDSITEIEDPEPPPMMSANRYLPFLIFQIILAILFFVFVRFEYKDADIRGFEDTHVMIFIGFGYLMTFLKKYCYSALGLNWFIAAMVIQWAILCQAFPQLQSTIPINKKVILEADVMSATILITFGAMLGLASSVQLLFIAILETFFASMNFYLVGEVYEAADIGGSIAIHSFGAYFGLACSWALNKNNSTKDSSNEQVTDLAGPSYVSDVTAMIGSIFLFIYWPSFNSALTKSDNEYTRAVVNTYLGIASASVVTFCVSAMVNHEKGKFDMVHVQNSTLAGGVALGSVCNMQVAAGTAIVMGMGAGFLSVLGYKYLTPILESKLGIRDTCGVNNLHGMPGLYSGILSAIVVAAGTKEGYGSELNDIFPAIENGRTLSTQATYQALAVLTTFLIAIVTGALTGFIANLRMCSPLKSNENYNDKSNFELPE